MIRRLSVAALAATLLGAGAVSSAAEEQSTHEMHHITIEHQVETAQSQADHEAVAKRFEDEATKLDKQASEHEKLAKRYHSGAGVGPKGNAQSLATHCDSFVKNLRASAAEAREMAALHRDLGQALAK